MSAKCPDNIVTPIPGGNLTPLGVIVQKTIKLDGQSVLEVDYEQSEHNGEQRGSIYAAEKFGFHAENAVIYGYVQTKISDDSQRMVIKVKGGAHSKDDDNDQIAKQGSCYGIGLTLGDGTGFLEKEIIHPNTPKFLEKIEYADPNWTSLGNINGKTIGVQVIYWNTPENTVKFECWVDTSVLDKDLNDLAAVPVPPNQWKLFFTAEDKGDWEGEPWLENQGVANGGEAMGLYFRINTEESTVNKFVGACEIIP